MAFFGGFGRVHTQNKRTLKAIDSHIFNSVKNADKLVETFACWKKNGSENFFVIASVGKRKLNETYLANIRHVFKLRFQLKIYFIVIYYHGLSLVIYF